MAIKDQSPSGGTRTVAPDSNENQEHVRLLWAVAECQDRAAFEQLFSCFAKRIYGMGMKTSRNEQIAKDLVQEVMLTVWQNAAAFNASKGSAKTWIFTLARNKCVDMLRRLQRQPATVTALDIWPEDLLDKAVAQEQTIGESDFDDALDLTLILRLSDRLPEEQRKALVLVYSQDHTHEEAASALNIPLGTVKSRLRLGLNKLRQWVDQDND